MGDPIIGEELKHKANKLIALRKNVKRTFLEILFPGGSLIGCKSNTKPTSSDAEGIQQD